MNNLTRTALSLIVLLTAQLASAQAQLTLTGPVGARQLIETVRQHPEIENLDLSSASVEGNHIPSSLFAGSKLRSIEFPSEGAITIGDGAFMGTEITELDLPASVIAIGDGAFAACPALKSVKMHGGEIGDYAFHNCLALEKVELRDVTSIGAHAFDGCNSLVEINLGDKLQIMGDNAMSHTAIKTFKGNAGLKSIGKWALASNHSLESVSFPEGVILGEGVLFDCPSVTDLQLPSSLKNIPAFAFTGSNGLSEHQVPAGVDSIGAMAYKDTDLKEISLSSSLEYIGSYAMENASRLSRIDATKVQGVPDLGTDVWAGVRQELVVLNVPDDLREQFRSALQWQDFNIDPASVVSPDASVSSVRMCFQGEYLIIEASRPMLRVEIYNEDGTCFVNDAVNSSLVSISTANLPQPLVLVRCSLDNGVVATAKLLR